MKVISRVLVKRILDTDADTSWIGEYSDKPRAGAIDRQERGDMLRNEFRYFNPANPEYAEQEYDRMENVNKGNVCFYGVKAEAEITLTKTGHGYGTIQTIHSGGLWGIESDSGESYFKEVEKEQLEELKEQLLELGFTQEEINQAVNEKEIA